jgi:catechol 2,3-dioxygenase-like lactoylglutathione lyase family enzyme
MAGRVLDVDHIGVSVSDMGRAVAFFRALGAEVTQDYLYDDPKISKIVGIDGVKNRICLATLHGKNFELLEYVEPRGRQAENHRPCDPGHLHIALLVEDIEGMTEQMRAQGFEPANEVQHNPTGSDRSANYCYGFDGLVVELIEIDAPSAPKAA